MAHHPSVQAHGLSEALEELRGLATVSAWVHGIMIVLLYLQLAAFTEWSARLDLARPLVRTALLAYLCGTVLMSAAALVSGFVTPRIALVLPAQAAADPAAVVGLAALAQLFNQAFAHAAAVLSSLAIAAWSLTLVHGERWMRTLAVSGLLIGGGCALAVGCGLVPLNVPGMSLVAGLQGLWTVGAGIGLLRGGVSRH